jgi:molybdopterin guanine dinucleotide-containing S/N-oxide reductase-like protein
MSGEKKLIGAVTGDKSYDKVVSSETQEKTFIKGLGFCGNMPYAGSNAAAVDVKDGKIIRIRPFHFDWKYKPEDMNYWQFKARGKVFESGLKTLLPPYTLGYKKRVYSPNRILYPLKRVDWEPGGENINAKNRGKSKYKRISWDEATTIIKSEVDRISEKYGPCAITSRYGGIHGETKVLHYHWGAWGRLLNYYLPEYTEVGPCGGCSWVGWKVGAYHVWGMGSRQGCMRPQQNCAKDMAEHTDLMLHWASDEERTPLAWDGYQATRLIYWYKELGIKQIYIDPCLNYAAAIHADKWIPVIPNTDAALHLAISYVWMTEDTYDKEYIATHSVGFDKYQDYVLGKVDGVPKTPAWASLRCGVPEWTIKALAREWSSKNTSILIGNGGPQIRGPYAHEPARLQVCNLAMQGLGKPGRHQVNMIEWNHNIGRPDIQLNTNIFPRASILPNLEQACRGNPRTKPASQEICSGIMAETLSRAPETTSWYGTRWLGEGQFVKSSYPGNGKPEIHMLWTDGPCGLACQMDGFNVENVWKDSKIEFFVAQHPWLENDCLYADIILPTNTKLEEEDIGEDIQSGQYPMVMLEGKCIEPLGESKSDFEAVGEVAKKVGIFDKFIENKNDSEWIKLGFDTCGIKDKISWEEFKEKGYYVIPTAPDWEKDPVGMEGFLKDPESNPLETPTGKIEFYSERLAKYFPDDKERPPVPAWVAGGPGWTHDESLWGEKCKKYPMLLVSNHPKWRVHVEHDDISWIREIPSCKVKGFDGYLYEPVWINPHDAASRGIENGDIVKIFNERGAVLGGAIVTERVIQGAVSQDHGARLDEIIPGKLDRGGSNNLISPMGRPSKYTSPGCCSSGYLVEVEKVTIAQMEDWRQKYPEAFARDYEPAYGPLFSGWIE